MAMMGTWMNERLARLLVYAGVTRVGINSMNDALKLRCVGFECTIIMPFLSLSFFLYSKQMGTQLYPHCMGLCLCASQLGKRGICSYHHRLCSHSHPHMSSLVPPKEHDQKFSTWFLIL